MVYKYIERKEEKKKKKEIKTNGKYIKKKEILSKDVEKKFNLKEGYIEKRTGIIKKYYVEEEKIEDLAINATKDLFSKGINKDNIGLIIVATTTTDKLMPGISNYVQKELNIQQCICLDILAGCSGYINAFDIASMYIKTGKVEKALIIGVEVLSKYVNSKDINTSIILSDGAGATLVGSTNIDKKYYSNIKAEGENNHILECKSNSNIYMEGKEIYKYAVTKTVENVKELLEKSGESLENIKYIVPHQSNMKIMKAIANRLKMENNKIYTNIEIVGNTFCASIPIALSEMMKNRLLKKGDKIILLGYGGGLNTGSILIEI